MSDWVPSTEQVRSHYVFDQSNRWDEERGESFDRWKAENDRQVWDEGWKARSERSHLKRGECVPAPDHINPYAAIVSEPSTPERTGNE